MPRYFLGKSAEGDSVDFCTYQDEPTDEVYGWFEKNYSAIKSSGGWWRTEDPEKALKTARIVAQLNGYTSPWKL